MGSNMMDNVHQQILNTTIFLLLLEEHVEHASPLPHLFLHIRFFQCERLKDPRLQLSEPARPVVVTLNMRYNKVSWFIILFPMIPPFDIKSVSLSNLNYMFTLH